MVSLASSQVIEICKDAAGIAGNIFAFGLFLSPMPTFMRIMRNQSTEQFSGLPYIYGLLNCLICAWYGTPLVSPDNLLVTSVNSVGTVFQLAYIVLYVMYTEKEKKVNTLLLYYLINKAISHSFIMMFGWILTVFGLFAIIVIGSLFILDLELRRNLVIRTTSVEFMPFCLSLSSFLMSASFLLYGIFSFDPFIYVPNGIGTLLGVVQLLLFAHYRNSSREDSAEGL
ncbi:hypothetical protein H5410_038758 [Solanum commersonii]|uniref:Sugar transporter SWEET1 n=1 Tax=Solanum commersonii TaxID=4109 RepID=A0A9J5YET3_SOLCO|nr:hypothetical protein H5410_038758 [Solanum commersonii]